MTNASKGQASLEWMLTVVIIFAMAICLRGLKGNIVHWYQGAGAIVAQAGLK